MKLIAHSDVRHFGKKIERIRRLRGMTENDLGTALGITAQDVAMLEQLETMESCRIKEIASALGVTEQGLIDFSDEKVLYNTINFYENSGVTTTTIANTYHQTINNNQVEKITQTLDLILNRLGITDSQGK